MTSTPTYRKLTVVVTVCLLLFTGVYANHDEVHPLAALLRAVPTTPAFAQMTANTVSFVDYRALESAAGLPRLTSRSDYDDLSEEMRAAWRASLQRVHAGPGGMINIVDQRITDMPDLLGFGYFDVDAALVYGSAPFTGTLLHSASGDFDAEVTAKALDRRGYERREVATGEAFGLGGDGMTDIENLEMGDLFGGDVGLSSRVAVFDANTLMNSFIWNIVFIAAEAHAEVSPSYGEQAAYHVMVDALVNNDATLLQAVILNAEAGAGQATNDDVEPLLPYELVAIADLQRDDEQVHQVWLLYTSAADAAHAASRLPAQIRAFDQGWLDTLNFDVAPVQVTPVDNWYLVMFEMAAPAPTPEAVADGAFAPATVFGFWVRAINGGTFFPFAVSPGLE